MACHRRRLTRRQQCGHATLACYKRAQRLAPDVSLPPRDPRQRLTSTARAALRTTGPAKDRAQVHGRRGGARGDAGAGSQPRARRRDHPRRGQDADCCGLGDRARHWWVPRSNLGLGLGLLTGRKCRTGAKVPDRSGQRPSVAALRPARGCEAVRWPSIMVDRHRQRSSSQHQQSHRCAHVAGSIATCTADQPLPAIARSSLLDGAQTLHAIRRSPGTGRASLARAWMHVDRPQSPGARTGTQIARRPIASATDDTSRLCAYRRSDGGGQNAIVVRRGLAQAR